VLADSAYDLPLSLYRKRKTILIYGCYAFLVEALLRRPLTGIFEIFPHAFIKPQ